MADPVTTLASALTNVTAIVNELSSLLPRDTLRPKKDLEELLKGLQRSTHSLRVVVSLSARLLDIEEAIERTNTDIRILSDSEAGPGPLNMELSKRLRSNLAQLIDKDLEQQLKLLQRQSEISDFTTLAGYEMDTLIDEYRSGIKSVRSILEAPNMTSPPNVVNLSMLSHQLTELSYLSKFLARVLIKSVDESFESAEARTTYRQAGF